MQLHPICKVLPPMQSAELDSLVESIKKSGLREEIVVLEDLILDGANRFLACEIAGVTPRFRTFGSRDTDGNSPVSYVLDMNTEHRFLDASQRAAAAANMLPFYEAESLTKTQAVAAAAEKFNVGESTVRAADQLKRTDGTGFDKVAKGEQSLSAAQKAAAQTADAARIDAATVANELKATEGLRKKHTKEIHKHLGEAFGTAFDNGVLLKTPAEMDDFLKLEKQDRKLIAELVIRGWKVKKAVSFMTRVPHETMTLADLILYASADQVKFHLNGHIITCRKAAEGEPGV